jgi:HEAT repeat protein
MIRSAAAIALARMHTQTALPFLIALLDDADPQMRATGVGGIARFANNVDPTDNQPAAGEWKYRTDDTIRNSVADRQSIEGNPGIIAFWKGWWTQHKSDLGY